MSTPAIPALGFLFMVSVALFHRSARGEVFDKSATSRVMRERRRHLHRLVRTRKFPEVWVEAAARVLAETRTHPRRRRQRSFYEKSSCWPPDAGSRYGNADTAARPQPSALGRDDELEEGLSSGP